jgi:NAD(P)H-hydrate epimerase
VVVLKGANTVIASPTGDLLRSEIATPALATAGSGDVLAGAIGAFLAAGLEPMDAAGCGVAVHGAAGLLAEERIGRAGVVARDIANLLPTAIQHLRDGKGR